MKLRQVSTTGQPIPFLLVDSTDHVTGKTGLTPTVTISKNGAAFGSPAGAVTELSSGWYLLAGNATDRGALGEFLIHATGTGADPTDDRYVIVAFDPFSALATPTNITAGTITTVTNLSNAPTAGDLTATMKASVTAAVPTAAVNAAAVWVHATAVAFIAQFAGITLLAKWLRALARSDTADATALTEINASGGTYDESTDSLQAAADTGGGGGATAAQVWAYTQRTLTSIANGSTDLTTPGAVTRTRGDTWTVALTVPTMANASKVRLAIKASANDTDAAAVLLALVTVPAAGPDGLQVLNGSSTVTAANATLVRTSNTLLTITVKAVATAELAARAYTYGVEMLDTSGNTSTLGHGTWTVGSDIVRTTS